MAAFTSVLASCVNISHRRVFDGVHRLGFIRWYSSVNTNPEIVVSKDGQMVVCYHPSTPFPYEHSRPLPRPDPARPEETHENVLKKQFVQYLHKERAGPDEKELAKMFHTTKHRWYPKNQKVKWMNKTPPRDREGC